jgi:predicted phosphodiesterase
VPTLGALGDIHGDFESARRIMERHPEVPFWLCVGDVADGGGEYEGLPAPLYWIKGNNENFDLISGWVAGHEAPPYSDDLAGHKAPPYAALPENLYYLPNGEVLEIPAADSPGQDNVGGGLKPRQPSLRIAGLGGTFAPTMYQLAAADLPHPRKASEKATALADRRRHFVREEVEACKAMQNIDVFLSHEAPKPFKAGRGIQAGKEQINEVLAAMRPRLHLFGHHHRFEALEVGGVPSVCLDLVGTSYLLIDRNTLEYQHLSS